MPEASPSPLEEHAAMTPSKTDRLVSSALCGVTFLVAAMAFHGLASSASAQEAVPQAPATIGAGDAGALTPEAAARVAENVQTCDDHYGHALGLPPDALRRESLPEGQLPAAVRSAVSTLDANEATGLSGAPSTVLMLCERRPNTEAALNRAAIGEQLALGNLANRANRLLAELRARATIERFE